MERTRSTTVGPRPATAVAWERTAHTFLAVSGVATRLGGRPVVCQSFAIGDCKLCGLRAACGTTERSAEMNLTAPLSFDRGSEQVEEMMDRGMPFACVEDLIDGARLSRDHKAALWLLAWVPSRPDPSAPRRPAYGWLAERPGREGRRWLLRNSAESAARWPNALTRRAIRRSVVHPERLCGGSAGGRIARSAPIRGPTPPHPWLISSGSWRLRVPTAYALPARSSNGGCAPERWPRPRWSCAARATPTR